jgi:BASS family bile acid:Na+ symporter
MEWIGARRYDRAATKPPETPLFMPILMALRAALAWLGRQGTRAVAASIFIGLAVPPLAAYVKPHLAEAVFVLLLFSYLRTDPAAFRRYVTAPGLTIVAAVWVMAAMPLLFGAAYAVSGVRESFPALYTIMILQAAISPITSSAAFAALIGLDVAFSLAAMIASNAISPITTVAFSYLFLGTSLFSPLELGIKLFIFFAGAGAVAFAIRRIAGQAWIERQSEPIDGLNVIAVFIFAIAAMEGVPRNVMADPLFALALLGLIFVLAGAMIGLSVLVFLRAGLDRGLVIGLLAGFRNIGVVMAAVGTSLPEVAWFYFALAQFPIFLLPALLQPLARRRFGRHTG